MAITVTCQCGKTLKAKDESAGKRAKCPGCGAILTIQADADTFDLAPETIPTAQTAAPAAPLAAPGAPEVPQEPAIAAGPIPSPTPTPAPARPPQAAAFPTRRQLAARGDNPRLTLSPRVIMLIVAAILIPTVMWLVRIGPMRAQAMWKEKAKIGQDDIADVLNRTFEKEIADMGITIKRQQDVPHILNSWFDEPVMPLTMPDVMKFQANSTEGKIQGEYYHKTRTVTCRVGVENNSPRTITGRVENDKVVFGK